MIGGAPKTGPYFHLSPGADLVGSLALCQSLSTWLPAKSPRWKWCMLGMRAAVKTGLSIFVAAHDEFAVLTPETRAAYLAWDADCPPPSIKILDLEGLLKAAQNQDLAPSPIRVDQESAYRILELDQRCHLLDQPIPGLWPLPYASFEASFTTMVINMSAALSLVEQVLTQEAVAHDPAIAEALSNGLLRDATRAIRRNLMRHAGAGSGIS